MSRDNEPTGHRQERWLQNLDCMHAPCMRVVIPMGWCLAVALSLLGSGCATRSRTPAYVAHPPPPSEGLRDRLGVITVVVTEPQATEVSLPRNSGITAAKGAGAGLLGPPVLAATTGDPNLFLAGLIVSPLTAVGGGIYGAFAGMSKKEYEQITMTLQKVMVEGKTPARLESGCVEAIRRLAPRTMLAPTNAPAGASQTTLEVVPIMIGLVAGEGANPPMTLNYAVQVRFVPASDGAELYVGQFYYFGATHTLRQWAADDGAKFRGGITTACDDLAGHIAERLFLVYELPGGFVESRNLPCDTKQ